MRSMRKRVVVAVGIALSVLATSCSGSEEGPTVLVDFSHDEFNSQFNLFFPSSVKVHAGQAITFRQTWTGEPHTVTLGTLVDQMLVVAVPLIEEWGHLPDDEIPEWVFETYDEATANLPHGWTEEGLNQTIARPCYAQQQESIPRDGGACPSADQPAFDGSQALFNSGVIPFDGPGTNRFVLELADDLAPGVYGYFCAIHGPFQRGTIEIVPADQPVPSAAEVALQAREEISSVAQPLVETFRRAREDGVMVLGAAEFQGNFAGLWAKGGGLDDGSINEFVPRDVTTRLGEPVTWVMFGEHSISFDVPEYFPIVEFREDGTVQLNDALDPPAGGSPEPPEEQDEVLVIDGGSWSGKGFFSSGLLWAEDHVEYTLRFEKPGTYQYACLIHPPMVGTVRVTA